jgi:hypothetical protein
MHPSELRRYKAAMRQKDGGLLLLIVCLGACDGREKLTETQLKLDLYSTGYFLPDVYPLFNAAEIVVTESVERHKTDSGLRCVQRCHTGPDGT